MVLICWSLSSVLVRFIIILLQKLQFTFGLNAIISYIRDTDMQLKYDQVKKVKNRPEFYKKRERAGDFFFCFHFLLDQGQKSN